MDSHPLFVERFVEELGQRGLNLHPETAEFSREHVLLLHRWCG